MVIIVKENGVEIDRFRSMYDYLLKYYDREIKDSRVGLDLDSINESFINTHSNGGSDEQKV